MYTTQEHNGDLIVHKPIGDVRRANFLRIVNRRLPNALEAIRKIESLLRQPGNYIYSEKDIDAICKNLEFAIDKLRHYHRPFKGLDNNKNN